MSSHSIKQTLATGTLVIVLGLPGMIQARKAPVAPGNPKAAKQGNIDIPPALMPAVKRAMKARKQLLQAKMAVLKAAQHLQSEVKKLEASSKTSSGKGRPGKAPGMNRPPANNKAPGINRPPANSKPPGMNPKIRNSFMDRADVDRGESLQNSDLPRTQRNDANELRADSKTNIKTQKSINPTGRSGSVHQKIGKNILGLLLTNIFNFESIVQNGAVTKGTVSKTGTISNAKNTLVGTPGASTAGAALAPFKGRIDEVLSEQINKVQLQLNTPAVQGNKLQTIAAPFIPGANYKANTKHPSK